MQLFTNTRIRTYWTMNRAQNNLSEMIDVSIDAHKAWKRRLDEAINISATIAFSGRF